MPYSTTHNIIEVLNDKVSAKLSRALQLSQKWPYYMEIAREINT